MKKLALFLPAVACLMIVGCKQKEAPVEEAPQIVIEGFTDTVQLEFVSEESHVEKVAPQESYFEKKAKQPTPKAAVSPTKAKGKAETIYVETDGAQGRVWGHVTMRGDRGTGTIHDWDENTLAVTVTRHGDELFAVDQNSRLYVFKLKK